MRPAILFLLCFIIAYPFIQMTPSAQTPSPVPKPPDAVYLLKPSAVFDGEAAQLYDGWVVLVRGEKIEAVGPAGEINAPPDAKIIDLPGLTLMPGLIEAHSHILLHPYTETIWNDQVAHESLSLRVARATNHARQTLLAGFTTIRDLGTEGAGYADVGLKQAVERNIIPGPRMLVVTRAVGAALRRVVRDQVRRGADWIKVYADYPWGPRPGARPTFALEELKLIVETARSAGVPVCAHATTKEGMRRAALAGVETIEHGDEGDIEVFRLMAAKGIPLCPTLAAS